VKTPAALSISEVCWLRRVGKTNISTMPSSYVAAHKHGRRTLCSKDFLKLPLVRQYFPRGDQPLSTFRQSDLTRALKGAIAAGVEVAAVEIDPTGKIVIMTGVKRPTAPENALDKWMAKHADQTEGH
jgi:hypothetical protein